jgi:hypothetical protein
MHRQTVDAFDAAGADCVIETVHPPILAPVARTAFLARAFVENAAVAPPPGRNLGPDLRYAATTAKGTDWFVTLVEVGPSSGADTGAWPFSLVQGRMRARYRASVSRPTLITQRTGRTSCCPGSARRSSDSSIAQVFRITRTDEPRSARSHVRA